MSIAVLFGIVVALALAATGLVATSKKSFNQSARIAKWIAFALVMGLAVALFPSTYGDSGWAALVLLGVPVGASLLALVADLIGRLVASSAWLASGILVAWSLITGLGTGLYFLVPGVVLILAAVMSKPVQTLQP